MNGLSPPADSLIIAAEFRLIYGLENTMTNRSYGEFQHACAEEDDCSFSCRVRIRLLQKPLVILYRFVGCFGIESTLVSL